MNIKCLFIKLQYDCYHAFSSVQFSSLVTSLSVKFVQSGSEHGDQVPSFSSLSSVHSVHFTNYSGLGSDWPDWLGSAQSRFSPTGHQFPTSFWEEQMSSSRPPPAEIPARCPGVCSLGGGMVRFADRARLLIRGWDVGRSDANAVRNSLKRVQLSSAA